MTTVNKGLKPHLFLSIFMLALATTTLELLLPRVWSVTLWYHFAFAAISLAMFGLTAGALIVFFCPGLFKQEALVSTLAFICLLFSASIILCFLTQLSIPYFPDTTLVGIYSLLLICTVVSIPFILSGIATTLILTRFPTWTGQIYASDLAGASLGCLLTLVMLAYTDGPTAVICSSLLASAAALILANASPSNKLRQAAMILTGCLAIFILANTILAAQQCSMLRPIWVKAQYEARPLFEKWNSYSRVSIFGDPDTTQEPTIWGLSNTYPKERKARELRIEMDSYLATVIPHFAGDFNEVDYLKYDLTNLAHFIRHNARVLIIGTGGGKDILSALVFQQKSVLGVEINEAVINAVTKTFGDFSGHLDRDKRVTLVNDEARSFIARQSPGFDIIQMSAIDTGMATGAGAFALTENSLYTVDAWKLFLEKLSAHGILSCSRWYNPNLPAEIYRLASLAREALAAVGVNTPRQCMVVLAQKQGTLIQSVCATVLISKQPFSEADLAEISRVADELHFDIVLMPNIKKDSILENILSGSNLETIAQQLPMRIDAPKDDDPYFFYLLKPFQILTRHASLGGEVDLHSRAEIILFELTGLAIFFGLVSLFLPFALRRSATNFKQDFASLLYFAFIGLGFMFIEVSQLQRLIIFLGHPSYSLSVVLFTLLLSSAIGSYISSLIVRQPALDEGPRDKAVATSITNSESSSSHADKELTGADTTLLDSNSESIATKLTLTAGVCLSVLIFLLIGYGLLTPTLLNRFAAASTFSRILVAASILFPLGIFMGTAMPLGLRIASIKKSSLTPWFWGVNGATSVCASVATVAIAVMSGISTAFWTGAGCYGLALLALVSSQRKR